MPEDIDTLKLYVGTEQSLERVNFAQEAFKGAGQFLLTTLSPLGSWIADGTWEAGHDGLIAAIPDLAKAKPPSLTSPLGWLECTGRFVGYHSGKNGGVHSVFDEAFVSEELGDLKLSLSRRPFGGASGSLTYTRFKTKFTADVYIYGEDPVSSQIFLHCYQAPFFGSSMTLQLTYF